MEVEEKEKAEEPVKLLTESELNALAAKILKAEIMGNDDLAAEIKAKLDAAKVLRAEAVAKGLNPDNPEPETVVKLRGGDVRQKRKKTKVETHSKGGDRVRYFGDDDKYDLKQLFEREKLNTAEDQMGMLNKYASKAEKTNDDFDVDDMMISKVAGKRSEEQEDVKRRNRAAAEQMAMEKTLHDCKWCIGSKRSQKHLMVAMGKSVYLSLPGTVCINSYFSYLTFLVFLGQHSPGPLSDCPHEPRGLRDQPRRGRLERDPGVQESPGQDVPQPGRGLCLHGDCDGVQEAASHGDRVCTRT